MVLSGFIIGILGSLHCVGMCGPIALALPGRRWEGRLLYNLGRIVTYSILGGLVALLGVGARMFQMQQAFSITMGILLLFWAVREMGWVKLPRFLGVLDRFSMAVRSGFSKWFGKGTLGSLFMLGILNGLLPCGLVYLGLFSAAITADVFSGMAVMALFGLGTFPVMFALSWSSSRINTSWRSRLNRILPYSVMFFGLLFIVRGMALGIPYLSPKMEVEEATGKVEMSCCHKAELKGMKK